MVFAEKISNFFGIDIGPGDGDGLPIKILLSDCKTNQQRVTAPKPALPRPKSRDDKDIVGKFTFEKRCLNHALYTSLVCAHFVVQSWMVTTIIARTCTVHLIKGCKN